MLIQKLEFSLFKPDTMTITEAVSKLAQAGVLVEMIEVLDLALYSIIQSPHSFTVDEKKSLVATHISIKNLVKTIYVKNEVPTQNDLYGFDLGVERYLKSLQIFYSCALDSPLNNLSRESLSQPFKSFADLINAIHHKYNPMEC